MKQMPYVLIFNVILFFIFNANAGFYIGASLGSDAIDFKQHSNIYQGGTPGLNVLNKTNLSGTGLLGGVFMGYEYYLNRLGLAVEANYNQSSTSFKAENNEYVSSSFSKTRYEMKNSFGFSLLPGVKVLTATFLYGRFGYSNSNVNVVTSDASLENIGYRRDGFRFGVGIKQNIAAQIAMRLEYSRTQFSNIKLNSFDAINFVTKNTKIIPRQQLVELGAIIQFV